MLSYLILAVIQFVVAFVDAPFVMGVIPVSGDARMFVHAAVYAVIVWLTGLVASLLMKGIRRPGTASLGLALVLALAGAAVVVFAPGLLNQIPFKFPQLFLPLAGAILGYLIRR